MNNMNYDWIKEGVKVNIPTRKSFGGSLEEMKEYLKDYKSDFLIVVRQQEDNCWRLKRNDNKSLGVDIFRNTDLEPYEEFPEKWCIIKNNQEICDWFNKQKFGTASYSLSSRNHAYIHSPAIDHTCVYDYIHSGYTEITFDQFKKHVLKENKEQSMNDNKEIVGYRLKEQYLKYKENAADIGLYNRGFDIQNTHLQKDCPAINLLKEAGVFDLWFEPVYQNEYKAGDVIKVISGGSGSYGANGLIGTIINKPEKDKIFHGDYSSEAQLFIENFDKSEVWGLSLGYEISKLSPEEIKKWKEENEIALPVINNYKGKLECGYVNYGNGCALFAIDNLKDLYDDLKSFNNPKDGLKGTYYGGNRIIKSIKLNTNVEITIEHLEQIVKFIEHKEKTK